MESNKERLLLWMQDELEVATLQENLDPDELATFQKIKQGTDVLAAFENRHQATFNEIKNKIDSESPKVRRLNYKWIGAIAATFIVAFGLYSVLSTGQFETQTTFGQQSMVTLLDGSSVKLNAQSKLWYETADWEQDREVHLDGEALFKVTKGSNFTVVTKQGTIQVLGTEFNVNTANDYFEVTCYEGKVKVVLKGDQEFNLTAGQSVRKDNGFEPENRSTYLKEPTWIKGVSSFESVPLRQVIKALEAQYELSFVTDQVDLNQIYTGSFTHSNLETALKTVFKPMNIEYNAKNKQSIRLVTIE